MLKKAPPSGTLLRVSCDAGCALVTFTFPEVRYAQEIQAGEFVVYLGKEPKDNHNKVHHKLFFNEQIVYDTEQALLAEYEVVS